MGPVVPIFEISQELNFLIAFVIGLGFGFALEQAGMKPRTASSNPSAPTSTAS